MIFAGAINIALASEAVAPWTCQIWHDRKQLAQVLVVWWWVWVCTLWCKSIILNFILKKNLQICNSTPARWQTQLQSAPMRPMPEGRWSCLLEPQSCLLAAPTPPERHRYGGRAVIWVWFPNSTHTSTRKEIFGKSQNPTGNIPSLRPMRGTYSHPSPKRGLRRH